MVTRETAEESGGARDETILRAAERGFVEHPEFGDSSRIRRRALARYQFGFELFADHLAGLRGAVDALAPEDAPLAPTVFREPVVRMLMEEAFDRLESGTLASPDDLESLIPQLIARPEVHLRHAATVGPRADIWVWNAEPSPDPLVRRLQERAAELSERGDAGMNRVTPDASMRRRIDDAFDLLSALLPLVGPSAIEHISSICVVGAQAENGTLLSASGGDELPSTIFIAPEQLDNLWDAAGHILHEGLHLKLFDVVRTGALVSVGEDVTVEIPWRHIRWTIPRVVFSFHVYVHMVLFKAAAERLGAPLHARFGEPRGNVKRGHAMSVVRPLESGPYASGQARAEFLGSQLEGEWSQYLTDDGRQFTRWLLDLMSSLTRWAHLAQPT
ncbi:MAG TPA: HEXXH motif-containing putative peptide modification protein [Kofleriaceae bacterium]|nr:HEXXH motif-containing putative peptide modification protein [Kofleriaceae bacterium]